MALQDVLSRAAGAGGELLHRLQHLRVPGVGPASVVDDAERSARRWRAVTVLRAPEDVGSPDAPPEPLAAFGDRIEVRVSAAPADKGTELAARFRELPGEDEIGELRSALRRAKQLLEVGEVLRVDPQPHGRRAPTPQGAAVEGAAARAPKEGVL